MNYEQMWINLKSQLERTKATGFREKTVYALHMMTQIECEQSNSGSLPSELIAEMENEADQFEKCSTIHNQRGNVGAAEVANRAKDIIRRFVISLRGNDA